MSKNRTFNWALLLLFTLIVSSCTEFDKNRRLNNIDELINTCIEKAESLKDIDSLRINQISSNFSVLANDLNQIEDTFSLQIAESIDDYKLGVTRLHGVNGKRSWIKSNLNQLQLSLASLKKDISGSKGQRQNYDKFIAKEKAKLLEIESLLEEIKKDYNFAIEQEELHLNNLKSSVDSLRKNKSQHVQ